MVELRLLFPSGNSQPHGDGEVIGETSQLGDEAVLLKVLQGKRERPLHSDEMLMMLIRLV